MNSLSILQSQNNLNSRKKSCFSKFVKSPDYGDDEEEDEEEDQQNGVTHTKSTCTSRSYQMQVSLQKPESKIQYKQFTKVNIPVFQYQTDLLETKNSPEKEDITLDLTNAEPDFIDSQKFAARNAYTLDQIDEQYEYGIQFIDNQTNLLDLVKKSSMVSMGSPSSSRFKNNEGDLISEDYDINQWDRSSSSMQDGSLLSTL